MTVDASDEVAQEQHPVPTSRGIYGRPWCGWVVVAAAFIFLTVFAGFGFYSLSTFSNSLVDHNGISLTAASTGSTIYLVVSGVGGLLIARVIRRYDVRWVLLVGIALSVLTLPLIGYTHTAWELWLVYLVYGLGAAGIGMLPFSTLMLRWFGEAPDRPIALSSTGMSVGGAVVAPWVATWISDEGLRTAGVGMAIITAAVLLPLTLLVVRSPIKATPLSPLAHE